MGEATVKFSLTAYGQQLVEQNLGLAHMMANRLRRPDLYDADDWMSEIMSAFIKSVALYNPNAGAKLSTYACRGMILHASTLYRSYSRSRAFSRRETPVDPESLVLEQHGRICDGFALVEGRDEWDHFASLADSVRDGNLLLEFASGNMVPATHARETGISRNRVLQKMKRASRRVREKLRGVI